MTDNYKNTEIGKIPDDWEVIKLGDIFKLSSGEGLSRSLSTLGDFPVYGGNGISFYHHRYTHEKPQIIIGRVGAYCGCIHKTLPKAWITDNALFIKAKLRDYDEEFLYHVLRKLDLNTYANKNAQPVISGQKIYPISIGFPKTGEQKKIAEILTAVDEKIEVIEAKISKTQELKRGLMKQLLTKGIGHTKFKDSPLGEIPESWEVVKGEDISIKITKGASPKWQGFDYQHSGVLFVTSENVRAGKLDINSPKFLPIEFNEKQKNSTLKNNDILINIVGASIGRSCIFSGYSGVANVNQAVCVFRLKAEHHPFFILCYLQHQEVIKRLLDTQVGSARQNLSLGEIRAFLFAIPKNDEQQRIASILGVIDEKSDLLKEKRDIFQQVKKGLMQQLLTGKIRVKI